VTIRTRTICGFDAALTTVDVSGSPLSLWQVADLERHVDREALLAAENPAEPPYWAYLWSGARVLAESVPVGVGRAVELGCGLGLPGLVAAQRGWRVLAIDRAPVALTFLRASADANDLANVHTIVADATRPPVRERFDLVLAAEILYERTAFDAFAATIAALLAPSGRALLTDAGRVDTRAFYDAVVAAGLTWTAEERTLGEEGLPVTVRLVELRLR
jgi:predicted nicotinamide N-methyase